MVTMPQQPQDDGTAPDASQQGGGADEEAGETAPDDESGEGDGMSNVTPEEQKQYEAVMNNAFKLMYPPGKNGEQASAGPILKLLSEGDPVTTLARVAVGIVVRLQESAEQAKQPIDPAVLFGAGKSIVEDLAEVAGKGKVHEFTDQELESAWYNALDMYRAIAVQRKWVDPKDFQGDIEELKKHSADGTLDEIVPGLQEKAEKMPQPEPGQPGQGGDGAAPQDQPETPKFGGMMG